MPTKCEFNYTVFETSWGYFGLLAGQTGLLRASLPMADIQIARANIVRSVEVVEYDAGLEKTLQEEIKGYFEGAYVDFGNDIAVDLAGFSDFARAVLSACRNITIGQTLSYSQLAEKSGFAGAARAAGNILAKNPLPLIIPCHRVICSNGKIGGFSAVGGADLKRRLLTHEQEIAAKHRRASGTKR